MGAGPTLVIGAALALQAISCAPEPAGGTYLIRRWPMHVPPREERIGTAYASDLHNENDGNYAYKCSFTVVKRDIEKGPYWKALMADSDTEAPDKLTFWFYWSHWAKQNWTMINESCERAK